MLSILYLIVFILYLFLCNNFPERKISKSFNTKAVVSNNVH